jgi:hypothetical protein
MNKALKSICTGMVLLILLGIINILFWKVVAAHLLSIFNITAIYISGIAVGSLLSFYLTAIDKMQICLFFDNLLHCSIMKCCLCWSVGTAVFFILHWGFMSDYSLDLLFVIASILWIAAIGFISGNTFYFLIKTMKKAVVNIF